LEKAIALTALEEFWLPARKTIFLGEWCKLWTRRTAWSALDHETLPFIWDSPGKVSEAMAACDRLYPRLLESVSSFLNEANGTGLPAAYFHVLLGHWLLHFAHQVYDKLLVLEQAIAAHADTQTLQLDPRDEYVPADIQDYFVQLAGDAYNQQIFSQILRLLGVSGAQARLRDPWSPAPFGTPTPGLKHAMLRGFSALGRAVRGKRRVVLVEPYVAYGERVRLMALMARSGLRVAVDYMSEACIAPHPDPTRREAALRGLGDSRIEAMLASLVPAHLPRVFLEGYAANRAGVVASRPQVSSVYFTANSLHTNTTAKFFFAEHRNKIVLLCQAHGGGYGLDLAHAPEEYERSLVDVFYTAGWRSSDKDQPLPVPKFGIAAKSHAKSTVRRDIVLAANEFPRYAYRLQFHPIASAGLYQQAEMSAFVRDLDNREALVLRVHPDSAIYGWCLRERLLATYPGLRVDSLAVSLIERLRSCRLFVSNAAGTAWLEALAANTPTLCFFDPRIYRFRAAAQPYLDELRRAGILFSTGAEAAGAVNRVYPDVDAWWNSAAVQEPRRVFVEHYANGQGWMVAWLREFSRVLETRAA
jgi:putative transferase (TIGR04331 family)